MVSLDPESGGDIDEFHEIAAERFATLNTAFASQRFADDGMVEKAQGGKEVVGSGPASHGSDAENTVSEPGT